MINKEGKTGNTPAVTLTIKSDIYQIIDLK